MFHHNFVPYHMFYLVPLQIVSEYPMFCMQVHNKIITQCLLTPNHRIQ